MQRACALLYCHLCPVWFYHIFPYYKQHGFVKKFLNITVFLFSLQHLSATFLILRRIQQDITTNVHRSSCKAPVILLFHAGRQTDRYEAANSPFSEFCEHIQKMHDINKCPSQTTAFTHKHQSTPILLKVPTGLHKATKCGPPKKKLKTFLKN